MEINSLPLVMVLLCVVFLARGAVAECIDLEPLMSGDQFRLLDSAITASSSLNKSHEAEYVRLLQPTAKGWCLGEVLNIEPQWLEITWPVEVVVTAIQTTGNIKSYNIQYSSMTTKNMLTSYREPESAAAKVFNATDSNSTILTFTEPVVLKRLRLYPHSWSSNPACLWTEVYGCLLMPICRQEFNIYTKLDVLPHGAVYSSTGEDVHQLLQNDSHICFDSQDIPLSIILNFSKPITLTRASTLFPIYFYANDIISDTYVDSYTIETSADGHNFSMYNTNDGSKHVITDKINTFWEPVRINRYLRLTITAAKAAFGRVCWHVDMYGCTTPHEYDLEELVDSLLTASITPAPTLFPSSTPAQDGDPETHTTVKKNYLIVGVVVPVVGVSLLVTVAVCVTGIAICAQLKKTADYKLNLLTPPSGPIRYSQQSPTLFGETQHSCTEHKGKVKHEMPYRSEENQIEDSGVELFRSIPSPVELGGAVGDPAEGYELIEVHVSPAESQTDVHHYDSIQWTHLGCGGGAHPPLSQTVSGSEYEMMESVQCLDENTLPVKCDQVPAKDSKT